VIRWITEHLGTAPAVEVQDQDGFYVVDVRDLVDKGGNSVAAVRAKIELGVSALRRGERTIVCCDYGVSRSNAVAAGVIARHQGLSFVKAVQLVQEKTGETEIKLEPLEVVRLALEEGAPGKDAREERLLVTGGGGFIGSQICSALRASSTFLLAPGRAELDLMPGATRLSLLARQHDIGTIVHLATPRVYTSNVALGHTLTMLRNVLEVCAALDLRLIYLSGWEVFSGYRGELVADESTPALPKGPYGETKYLAEELIASFRRNHGLSCTVIRSSPVYGVTSDRPKFIHNFLAKARRGDPIVTHRYLNGDAALDLLHIDDLVTALKTVIRGPHQDGLLHLGTGTLTSTYDIADFICRATGSSSAVSRTEIESHTARISMYPGRARSMLGWQPTIDLWAGLHDLINHSRTKKP
jgi:nucleoside-diphosphate-sugar epimerase